MKNRGFIGLFITMVVGLAILASIGYNTYHDQSGGFMGQIRGQLERPGDIWDSIISGFSSFSPSTISSTTTVTTNASGSNSEIITDWKTYTNDEYGFEVKYPKDWNVLSGDPDNLNSSNNSPLIMITSKDFSTNNYPFSGSSVRIFIRDKVRGDENLLSSYRSKIDLNGAAAYMNSPTPLTHAGDSETRRYVDNSLGSDIAFEKDGKLFSILLGSVGANFAGENKITQQIASTFKFTR